MFLDCFVKSDMMVDGQGDPVIRQLCVPQSRLAKKAWLTVGVVAVALLIGFAVYVDHTCQ